MDDRLGQAPDLVVDKLIEIDGTLRQDTYRKIVFHPGGKIRVLNGGRYTLWARSISAVDGGVIDFDGEGAAGVAGSEGARCTEGNCNDWWTDRKEDFENANRNCLPTEWGGRGAIGGPGGPGARIQIFVATYPILGSFRCNVAGGAGGPGGKGGQGRWHIHNTGGLPRYQCPTHGVGEPGPRGPEGVCEVQKLAPPRTGD